MELRSFADYQAEHFRWTLNGGVARIMLNRPDRKNPLTFESYAELRDLFRGLSYADDVHAVVIHGAGSNFSSGGDVHEIIGPLVDMSMVELMRFTRMTGDVVKAMRGCPQIVVSAVDGVCAGAGAILAMASDLRYATPAAKTGFLFVRVGLAGCDMGACSILPRIIGQGRASELLFSGRMMTAQEGERWGFYNELADAGAGADVVALAIERATRLTEGPTFAHGMTKTMLNQEWNMSLDQVIESEAQAQAICMQTEDFERAYRAFVAKEAPRFQGN